MYPPTSSSSSSSCSSSHGSIAPSGAGNLTRYGSAPGSLLTTAHYFSSCDTEPKPNNNTNPGTSTSTPTGLQRSSNYCFNNLTAPLSSHQFKTHTDDSSSLVRHNSSPAGFLNRLATASSASDNDVNFSKIGVSVSRGLAVYNSKGGCDTGSARRGISRLNSQLSFTKDCLSQITEESNDEDDNAHRRKQAAHSYAATANFEMGSWDDSNAVMFSSSPSKRAKTINTTDISSGFNIVDSQLQFGLAETALEMATMENLIDIPHDSVPCKVRAKRGFATHPRSIAERERRTRISGKLKKLQDLVPNMDKQTSYADMLDLAVEHIKGLQTQVQNLHKEAENCTCGCGQNM